MILVMGVVFVWGSHPLIMIFMLVGILLVYSLMIFSQMGSFWYSYTLMLVMLSGVLVVFTYILSLIPNDLFEMSGFIILLSLPLLLFFSDLLFFMNFDLSMGVLILWNKIFGGMMFFMVSFLLWVMFMVVELSGLFLGAMKI